MAKNSPKGDDRSVTVGGSVIGSNVVTGDKSSATVSYKRITLPPPHTVNIQQELAKLRESLGALKTDDALKIGNALSDAESELKKPKPDKSEVGGAVERALKYAKEAIGFGELAEKLKPSIVNVAAWLGANWHSLLGYIGLSV